MLPLVLALSLLSTLLTVLSIVSVYRLTSSRRRARLANARGVHDAPRDSRSSSGCGLSVDPGDAGDPTPRTPAGRLPPVTVLKPLCGADDALEANLETFFRQDHPDFELVFGVEGHTDPAIPVVRRLRERFPKVKSRLVVHSGGRALNPKVNNLEAMLAAQASTTHDLVVISDSNIAVGPSWLVELSAEYLRDPRHGLVMNLFVGRGEETLGATLENLHLAGPVAGSMAVSNELLDNAEAVGKSMMFSRSTFESLGGFASVGSLLAEDFVMGRMFARAGYRVGIAPTTVVNVTARTTVSRFLSRQLRWSLLRSRITPAAYPLEPVISPMLPALLAPLTGPLMPLFILLGLTLTLTRDATQWLRLRGREGLLSALPLGPIKEVALLAVWALAPFLSRVSWRGKRFRVAAGSRLYAERPMTTAASQLWE